jgi:hypothetical protein
MSILTWNRVLHTNLIVQLYSKASVFTNQNKILWAICFSVFSFVESARGEDIEVNWHHEMTADWCIFTVSHKNSLVYGRNVSLPAPGETSMWSDRGRSGGRDRRRPRSEIFRAGIKIDYKGSMLRIRKFFEPLILENIRKAKMPWVQFF